MQRLIVVMGMITALAVTGLFAHAQDDAQDSDAVTPWLTAFSPDPEHPALFQPLPLDAEPDPRAFAARLDLLDSESDDLPESLYIAIENTAWSEGAVGLRGDALLPAGTTSSEADDPGEYVALEVWTRMGNLVLRDDGQGLMFPLEYVPDLDRSVGRDAEDKAVPGYRLDVLITQRHIFRLYRIVEENGLPVWGRTHVRVGNHVDSQFVSFEIDPIPVLGDLLLDVHILALPAPTPTPEPLVTETPAF